MIKHGRMKTGKLSARVEPVSRTVKVFNNKTLK